MPENYYSILILFVILFSTIIVWVLMTDWKKLEELYRTNEPAPNNLIQFEFGRIGIASYRGSLCIGVSANGLYLSIVPIFNFGLKPLLIPWDKIKTVEKSNFLPFDKVCLTLSSPNIKIIIRKEVLSSAKQYLPNNTIF